MVYINLFHGRTDPHEELEDQGTSGPVIGPVNISMIYGEFKIHDSEDWSDFEFVHQYEDMIFHDGVYYGEFEIWTADEPMLQQTDIAELVISFDEYRKRHWKKLPPNLRLVYTKERQLVCQRIDQPPANNQTTGIAV
jgi:hypothetical protein